MTPNPQFAGGPLVSESPEALAELAKIQEREELLNSIDAEAGLKKVGDELYGDMQVRTPEEIVAAQQEEAAEKDPETDLFAELDAINGDEEDKAPQLQEDNEIQQIKTNGEYMPLFNKFAGELDPNSGNPKLNSDDLNKLQVANITSENYAENINNLDITSDKKIALTESIGHLNNPERIEKAQGELSQEFSDVFKDAQLEIKSGEPVWKSDFHAEAFSVISQHYMGGETKTPEERTQDLKLALSMAAEDLGAKAKININAGNTEFYNKNLRIAQNMQAGETERFEALTNIAQIINHVEGVKGKGKQTELMRLSGQQKLAEAGKFEEFQQQFIILQQARETQNKQQIQQITQSLKKLSEEAGLSSGEATALIGGEIDMIGEDISETPMKAA